MPKPWMTLKEYVWLSDRIPQWHKRKEHKGFMRDTTVAFLETFPDTKVDRSVAKKVGAAFVFSPDSSSY